MADLEESEIKELKKMNRAIGEKLQSMEEQLNEIQDNQEELEFRQTKMEERVAGLQKDVNQGLGLSGNSKLKVTDSDGEPTPEAFKVLYDVIKAGVEGIGNQYFMENWDYGSRQSANNKKNAVANTFPELLKVHGNKKAVGSENKLVHREISKAGVTKEELLEEVKRLERSAHMSPRDKNLIRCPECSETEAPRSFWKDQDWECYNCEAAIEPQ